jgi:hypothetical protein
MTARATNPLDELLPIKQILINGTPQRLARILDIVGIPASFDSDTGTVTLDALEEATSESAGLLSSTLFQYLNNGVTPDVDSVGAAADTFVCRNASGEIWCQSAIADPDADMTIKIADLEVAATDARYLYVLGQDLASSASDGRSGGSVLIRMGRPKTTRDTVDSPGNLVVDHGSCASGHSFQSGALAHRVNLSGAPGGSMVIGMDTAFFGSGSAVPVVYKWAADISLGLSWYGKYGAFDFSNGGAGALAQFELPTASSVGFRIYIGTTAFQVTNSAITLARAATFSSTVAFSSTLLSSLTFDASLASVAIEQAQDATAAGAAWSIRAQRGASGFVGGDLTLGGGAGGTGGTNLAGNTCVELGQTVGGATAELKLLANGTRFGGIKVDTASRMYVSNAASVSSTGLLVEATSGYLALKSATSVSLESTTDTGLYCTANYGFTKSWQHPSGASSVRETYETNTTTNTTPLNIGSVAIANDRVAHVSAVVVCYRDNATVSSYEVRRTFRAAGGTATPIGTTTAVHTAEDAALAGCAVDLVGSGGTATAQCTGIGATTLRWEVYMTVHYGKKP